MTCKDCKGSGKYMPLIGPAEPCRSCQDAPDVHLSRVPLDDLWLTRPVTGYQGMVNTLIAHGYNSFYPIKYYRDISGQKLVSDGNIRVAALRAILKSSRETFNRVLPDGLIPAKEEI